MSASYPVEALLFDPPARATAGGTPCAICGGDVHYSPASPSGMRPAFWWHAFDPEPAYTAPHGWWDHHAVPVLASR